MLVHIPGLIILLLLILWHHKIHSNQFHWVLYSALLLLKFIAGLGFGWLYFYYYQEGDVLAYHQMALKYAGVFFDSPLTYFNFLIDSNNPLMGGSRILLTIKIISILYLITGSSFWISALYFSFIGFVTLVWLYEIFITYFPKLKMAVVFSFFLYPSFVLWSSGISKDALAFLFISLIIGLVLRSVFEQKITLTGVLIFLLSAYLLWRLKYYYAAVLIPLLSGYWMIRYFGENLKKRIGLVSVLLIILLFTGTLSHPNLNLDQLPEVIYANNLEYSLVSDEAGFIHYKSLSSSWSSIIKNFPKAVFFGIFGPLWSFTSVQHGLASIENLILLTLVITAFFNYKFWIKNIDHPFLLICLLIFIVIISGFLALSTPNFGTLARFRIGFQPFLTIIILTANYRWLKRLKIFA